MSRRFAPCGPTRARRPRTLAATSTLLALALLAAPALAQSYESALVDGVAARDRALETGSARDWRQALEHFARALEIQHANEAAFEYAEAAAALKLTAEAFGGYETALAGGISGKAEARARAFLSEHAAEVGHLEVIGSAGAVVFVGDERRGTLPLARAVAVLAGNVRVRVEGADHAPWLARVNIGAGRSTELRIELASVMAAGTHRAVGTNTAATTNAAAPGDDTGEAGWVRPTLIGGSALFVAGAGAAIVTTALLPSAWQELEDHCSALVLDSECQGAVPSQIDAAQSAADRIQTLETIRWIGVAGAAAGAIAAGFGAYELFTSDDERAASIELRASSAGVQLNWGARF